VGIKQWLVRTSIVDALVPSWISLEVHMSLLVGLL
jgi:hypothetical protein